MNIEASARGKIEKIGGCDSKGSQGKEDAARSRNGCGANDWSGFSNGSGQAAIFGSDDEFFIRCDLRASAGAVLGPPLEGGLNLDAEIPLQLESKYELDSKRAQHWVVVRETQLFFCFFVFFPFFLFSFFFIYNTYRE